MHNRGSQAMPHRKRVTSLPARIALNVKFFDHRRRFGFLATPSALADLMPCSVEAEA